MIDGDFPPYVERMGALSDLARESDVVSLHTPLTSETRGMISASFFAARTSESLFVRMGISLHDLNLSEWNGRGLTRRTQRLDIDRPHRRPVFRIGERGFQRPILVARIRQRHGSPRRMSLIEPDENQFRRLAGNDPRLDLAN